MSRRLVARRSGARHDVIGLAALVGFALAYLSPALRYGSSFGPATLGRELSQLTMSTAVPNNGTNGDTITQSVPWNTLDWLLVHHGQLPLWNDLSGTGLPQLFNFESAPLSLASIAGYAFPLSVSFLVTVAAKLLIAGSGAYLLCRLLGTGALAACMAGTTFMLSGAFSGGLGTAVDGPVAWSGWILAGAVLTYRRRGQVRYVGLLAASVAFSIYAGFPESSVLLAISVAVVLVVTGVATLVRGGRISADGVGRVGTGVVTGVLLAAPLLLPGASVLTAAARNGKDVGLGLPLHASVLYLTQGFFGLPTSSSYYFGPGGYYDTAAYVGVIAVILAAVAAVAGWRRPIVLGLVASTLVGFLVVYQLGSGAPVQTLLGHLGLRAVAVQRMQSVMELDIAVLAGLGLDLVVDRVRDRRIRFGLLGSSLTVLVVLGALWRKVASARLLPGVAAGNGVPDVAGLEAIRRGSLVWPTCSIVLVLAVLAAVWTQVRRPHGLRTVKLGAVALVAAQGGFLVSAGADLNSYSTDAFPRTPAVATVSRVVGSGLLGLDGGNTDCGASSPHLSVYCGLRLWTGVAFYPETNIAYGVDELGMHDPTIPQSYFDAWPVPDADQATPYNLNLFAPSIDSVALAQRYGVTYVLAAHGRRAPPGMHLVAQVGGERLYSVPGSGRFAFIDGGGPAAGTGAPGRPRGPKAAVLSTSHPDNSRYVVEVRVPRAADLAVRITAVAGWHATADGRRVAIGRYDGGLLRVRVPAGTRTLVLRYWPDSLTGGLVLAAGALFGLVGWGVVNAVRRRGGASAPAHRPAPRGRLRHSR